MARPQKEGLDYFPIDCGFFSNRKVKSLRRGFGEVGILTYFNLLCKVYKNGYYLKFDNLDELAYDIAEEIANVQLSKVTNSVTRCIHYMTDNGLLDGACLEVGVITSRAIQEQYITSLSKSKRKAIIKEYALISYTFVDEKNGVNTEETEVNAEETEVNTELMQQTKQNKTKLNKTNILDSQTAEADEGELEFYLTSIRYRVSELKEDFDEYKERILEIVNQSVKVGKFHINKVEVTLVELLKAIIALFVSPIQFMDVFDAIDNNLSIKNKFLYTVAALYNTAMKF